MKKTTVTFAFALLSVLAFANDSVSVYEVHMNGYSNLDAHEETLFATLRFDRAAPTSEDGDNGIPTGLVYRGNVEGATIIGKCEGTFYHDVISGYLTVTYSDGIGDIVPYKCDKMNVEIDVGSFYIWGMDIGAETPVVVRAATLNNAGMSGFLRRIQLSKK